METTVKSREITQVKRICQNVSENFSKVNKLKSKVAELQNEIANLQVEIDEMEAPVMRKFGHRSTDLIEKVILPKFNEDGTPKLDKDGRQIKETKYILKYPDTFVPVVTAEVIAANVDAVKEEPIQVPVMEGLAGSDYDLDKERIAE